MKKAGFAGFIGRNGAGKTTTIKSMLNLVHPDSGEIEYFGLNLQGNEAKIKQRIGYSNGTVNYYPKKKLKDIIGVTKTFYSNWDDAACLEYLKLFHLDTNKTPSELSEGMKVKANLLLALSHRADILILDEPTSGLDPFSRDELLETFLMLKDRGTAILFSTHITSDLEKCADDILYIHDGKLIASLPRNEFRNKFSKAIETLDETMVRLERGFMR
ncbi:ABC transporter ATP-binding protein [Thermocaproicibacter melissae]|uniref:ABC transporter ATP-binding protein n=1 Tax=Thermocaproicibacter melissae TaxID=2966552 RepID=UPI0031FE7097